MELHENWICPEGYGKVVILYLPIESKKVCVLKRSRAS